jgi:hypothetical protein
MTAAASLTGIGITRVSQALLSLSSILRPLNANLSNTFMSAGFAGFQFGGLASSLSLAASATATWANAITGWIKVAMNANFQTRGFFSAFTKLQTNFDALRIELGVIAQEAFAPMLNTIADFISKIDTAIIEKAINLTASLLTTIVNFTVAIANRAGGVIQFLNRLMGGVPGTRAQPRGVGTSLAMRRGRGSIGEIADAGSSIQNQILKTDDKQLLELQKQTAALNRLAAREEELRKSAVPAVIGR